MKSTSEVKLWRSMTDDEQRRYVERLTAFESEKLARLEQKQEAWGVEQRELMDEALELMAAWQFARDFVDKALRYGDYAARVYRVRFYVEKIKLEIERLSPDMLPTATDKKRKPGRPASAATLAKREAERKAAKQQVEMFKPAGEPAGTVAHSGDGSGVNAALSRSEPSPVPSPTDAVQQDYRLPIAQKRMLLTVELAQRTEDIRTLRGTMAAAAERAKTLAELNRPQKEIEDAAQESIKANDAYQAILADIDAELATVWYRLQNDEPYRERFLQKHGFKTIKDMHADLLHDLRKHYEKVKSPEFDLRCRTLVEQESPEYVARQKEDAARKKEVQDIIRYFKRKDKGQKLETARAKFKRLEELLGKKEAADYKPLLTKIEGLSVPDKRGSGVSKGA